MANIQKYNHSVGKIEIGHDLRLHKEYKNKGIDLDRSHLNYHFNETDPLTKLEQRIKQIYIYGKNGKHANDINYVCSCCIHYPENCPVDEETFFIAMDKILTDRFGKDNKISSVVHLDEKRQHMHYKFMPVIYNDKKDRYELCAKKVINRDMLKRLHKDLEDDLFKYLGVKVQLHDPTNHIKGQNIDDIEDYKKYKEHIKQLEDKIAQLEKGIFDREEKINQLNIKGQSMVNEINRLCDKLDNLKEQCADMQNDIRRYLNNDMNLDEKINFNRKYNIDEIIK